MSEFWDEKYDIEEYRYGRRPNRFVADNARDVFAAEGRILDLGSGEGRNAVWLAEQGYEVTAVEQSRVGIDKTLQLAGHRGVRVNVIHAKLEDFEPQAGGYDGVVLNYLHLPPEVRQVAHAKAVEALTPGGVVLLEGFRPAQLDRDSGGPPEEAMMFTEEMLQEDFSDLEIESIAEDTIELDEGHGHRGLGDVIRMVARKPVSGA